MSKAECPEFFLDWLREQTHRAMFKMELEQERDPCCVWAEFETLILGLDDFFKQCPPGSIKIIPVKPPRPASRKEGQDAAY